MNEFPRDFPRPWHEIRDNASSSVVGMNGSEYLAIVQAAGLLPTDFPVCQPIHQHKIWSTVEGTPTSQSVCSSWAGVVRYVVYA